MRLLRVHSILDWLTACELELLSPFHTSLLPVPQNYSLDGAQNYCTEVALTCT